MDRNVYENGIILGILSIFWGIVCGFIGFTIGVIGLIKSISKHYDYKVGAAFILNIIGLVLSIASIVLIIIFVIF